MEQNSVYEKNAQLLKRFQAGDETAEEKLIETNLGLVRKIARRFLDRGTEYEDLVQIGSIGMVKAIRSFSLDRGTMFSTYAVPLIVGEIRRHLRDDGPIKVSRIYKKQGVELMREKTRIQTEEGREPGIAELAKNCGYSLEEAAISLDCISPVSSLSDCVYGEDTVTLEGVIPDTESEEENEFLCDKIALSQCLKKLPELWNKIVLLLFYRNMTQQETAAQLGLTQVKISREEKKILAWLKEKLS